MDYRVNQAHRALWHYGLSPARPNNYLLLTRILLPIIIRFIEFIYEFNDKNSYFQREILSLSLKSLINYFPPKSEGKKKIGGNSERWRAEEWSPAITETHA